MKTKFNLPNLEYLKFGNVFSGSCKSFNFKIFPDLKMNEIRVVVWEGNLCFEKSNVLFDKNFKLSDEILKDIDVWLEKKLESVI